MRSKGKELFAIDIVYMNLFINIELSSTASLPGGHAVHI